MVTDIHGYKRETRSLCVMSCVLDRPPTLVLPSFPLSDFMLCRNLFRFSVVAAFTFGWLMIAVLDAPSTDAGTFRAADSSEVRNLRNRIRASQFLSRATFGPTEEMITELSTRIGQIGFRRACEEWIDEQIELPMTSQEQTCRDIVTNDGRVPTINGVGVFRIPGAGMVARRVDIGGSVATTRGLGAGAGICRRQRRFGIQSKPGRRNPSVRR